MLVQPRVLTLLLVVAAGLGTVLLGRLSALDARLGAAEATLARHTGQIASAANAASVAQTMAASPSRESKRLAPAPPPPPVTAPPPPAPGAPAECAAMQAAHAVVVGSSWGTLPPEKQRRWATLGCDAALVAAAAAEPVATAPLGLPAGTPLPHWDCPPPGPPDPTCKRIQHQTWTRSWSSVSPEDKETWKSLDCGCKLRARPKTGMPAKCPKREAGWDVAAQAQVRALKDKYKGERCVLIANGPSLNKIRWDWQENFKVVMGMNKIYIGLERYLLRAISMSTCPHSFLAISRSFLLVFSPFFRRSLRLGSRIPETGTKTRKNGPKRSKNGGSKTPS